MSYSLSKQIAHCYFRAWKCGELAARSINAADRQVYGERKQAWLTLARSYEFSERLGQMRKEMQKQGERSFSLSRNTVTATKLPNVPLAILKCNFWHRNRLSGCSSKRRRSLSVRSLSARIAAGSATNL